MATHSSILAWRIPWTEEPGGLQSIKSQRVDLANTFTCRFLNLEKKKTCFLKSALYMKLETQFAFQKIFTFSHDDIYIYPLI